ncbi:hypothetical protein GALMADRAFT_213035 [Galerina marginata CBS 339.88]|uniref:Uncharacterized protein n=1 Tax=Galerina marginata (strain CBS 339.88) TaxID=685588 RepID=A0A067T250_GALM3|nr:hypothetical protein GALMADRAFT_213035 [Galerina marginata CBS 339.88]
MNDFQREIALYSSEEQLKEREERLARSHEEVLHMNEQEGIQTAQTKLKGGKREQRKAQKKNPVKRSTTTHQISRVESCHVSELTECEGCTWFRFDAALQCVQSSCGGRCITGLLPFTRIVKENGPYNHNGQEQWEPGLFQREHTASTLVAEAGSITLDHEMECHILRSKVTLLEKMVDDLTKRKDLVEEHLSHTHDTALALVSKFEEEKNSFEFERNLCLMREEAVLADLASATLRVQQLQNDKRKLYEKLQQKGQALLDRDQIIGQALDDMKDAFSRQHALLQQQQCQVAQSIEHTKPPFQPIESSALTWEALDRLSTDMGDWYFTIRNATDPGSPDQPSTSEVALLRKTMEGIKRWRMISTNDSLINNPNLNRENNVLEIEYDRFLSIWIENWREYELGHRSPVIPS